jgi:hypothetical protein
VNSSHSKFRFDLYSNEFAFCKRFGIEKHFLYSKPAMGHFSGNGPVGPLYPLFSYLAMAQLHLHMRPALAQCWPSNCAWLGSTDIESFFSGKPSWAWTKGFAPFQNTSYRSWIGVWVGTETFINTNRFRSNSRPWQLFNESQDIAPQMLGQETGLAGHRCKLPVLPKSVRAVPPSRALCPIHRHLRLAKTISAHLYDPVGEDDIPNEPMMHWFHCL